MNRRSGMSLFEMIIGMGVTLAVLAAAMKMGLLGQTFATKAAKENAVQADFGTLSAHLQKYVASGDMRFFGFTGTTAGGETLSRALLPLPGRCADLTSADCQQDTGLLYVHYNKSVMPAVPIICSFIDRSAVSMGPGNPADTRYFLVDGTRETYGKIKFPLPANPSGFTVDPVFSTDRSLNIGITTGTLLATINEPNTTLWVALGPPKALKIVRNSSWNPSLQDAENPGTTCRERLTGYTIGSSNSGDVSKLAVVRVRPFQLTYFTGQRLPLSPPASLTSTNDTIRSALGTLPTRMIAPELKIVGRAHVKLAGKTSKRFRIGLCQTATDSTFTCPASAGGLFSEDVRRLRIDASYTIAFGNVAPHSEANRYEWLGPGMTASNARSCPSPKCLPLTVPALGNIKYRLNNEELSSPDPAKFSMIKQQLLERLSFRWTRDSDGKESEFHVIFPQN